MFDALVTADLLVDDPDAVARNLVDVLALPEPKPSWIHQHGVYKAYFLRANARRIGAPTAIEVIGPHPVNGFDAAMRSIMEMQGARPMKTHATVFSVADPYVLVEKFRLQEVPHRLVEQRADDPLSFARLFVGQLEEDPTFYDPRFDAGLVFEFVPTSAMALKPDGYEPAIPDDSVPGAPVRVAGRAAVVRDLDAVVATIERYMDLSPSQFSRAPDDGARVAIYRGEIPSSATFEIFSPTGDGPLAEHLAKYGDGVHRIAVAVNGLDAAAARLADQGIAARRLADAVHGERLSVDPAALQGALVDLVEA